MQFDSSRSLEEYRVTEMTSYKQWLKPFFLFYSKDIFKHNIICTYSGELYDKDNFPGSVGRNFPMTVVAPLLRHSNTAKSVKNLDIADFMEACQFSYKYLHEYKARNILHKYYDFDPYERKTDETYKIDKTDGKDVRSQ